jgi:hypothetical protein
MVLDPFYVYDTTGDFLTKRLVSNAGLSAFMHHSALGLKPVRECRVAQVKYSVGNILDWLKNQ